MSPLPAIRRADARDTAAVAAFLRDNFLLAYGHCSTPENVRKHVAVAFGTERIGAELDERELLTLVADDADGGVAAVSQLAFASKTPACVAPPAVEVRRFYVAPAWHGTGLADALMAQSIALAAPRGKALWLSVWEEAPRAVGFYRRSGFAVAGTTLFVVGDDPKDDWVMARPLP
jgi:GNAT superfamily N-acetyltransferase